MKCTTTKKLANELTKACRNNYCIERIYYCEGTHNYMDRQFTSDFIYGCDNKYNKDYNLVCTYFAIVYKSEHYAMNKYCNQEDLRKIANAAKNEDGTITWDAFLRQFLFEYEI